MRAGAAGEQHYVTPDLVVAGRLLDERGGQLHERIPVRKSQGTRIVEFVLNPVVQPLPALDSRWVAALDDLVTARLFHDANENREAVLDRGDTATVVDPFDHRTVNSTAAAQPPNVA
jgi:hypothetical protein